MTRVYKMSDGVWHIVSSSQEVGTRSQLWGLKDIANLNPAPLFQFTGSVGWSLAVRQAYTPTTPNIQEARDRLKLGQKQQSQAANNEDPI